MLVSINSVILDLISRIFASTWRLKIRVFLPQFDHQPVYLIPIKTGDLPDLFIAQACLTSSSTLNQNAQYLGFGGFPIEASTCFTLITFSQAVVQVWVDNSIFPESGKPVYERVSVRKAPLFNRQSKANMRNKGLRMMQLMLTSINLSIEMI